ncbi:hypothetical protein [Absidia glauca]|uniref:Nudix hydrolase domain-containing protein n=1 Tax=Absidia glauca TaxID=4829 RepID=A0A163MG52_ABSGL|nr:hypothetical protein [Absidia glauca]
MSASKQLAIRPSATLIVAAPIPTNAQQEGQCNYRILMMKRNGKSSFVHAHVFPGGVVDAQDNGALWANTLPKHVSSGDTLLTLKICAIRETFEESGLLLTTPPAHTVPELDTEVWRHRVHEDASEFKSMCDLYHLQPAVDRLIPFANWITPAFEKKRFNTLFFLTVLQQTVDGQQQETIKASADGKETVQMDWFDPQQGLDKYNEKKIVLFPPQWYSLHSLNQVPRHEDLVAQVGIGALRTQAGDPITIRPQGNPATDSDYTGFLAYPGDEVYSTAQEDTSKDYVHLPPGRKGDRHRLYFKGKMQDVALERNVDITKLSNMAHL